MDSEDWIPAVNERSIRLDQWAGQPPNVASKNPGKTMNGTK